MNDPKHPASVPKRRSTLKLLLRSPHPTRLPWILRQPLAILLTAAGFSFALATSSPRQVQTVKGRESAVKARATMPALRFTEPFLKAGSDTSFASGGNINSDPQGFDLGDFCQDAPFVRYISATGGFVPYSFQIRPLLGSNNNGAKLPVPPLPNLTLSGKMTGPLSSSVGSFLRFNILLSDFIATQRVGTFRMNLFDCSSPTFLFRIAQDQLPEGQQNNTYFTRIGTVGGIAPAVFQVVPGSVTVNNTPLNRLEDAGLSLSSEGTLFGRPIKSGDIHFTVQARDNNNTGVFALARNGAGVDQTFVIPVKTKVPVTSELFASHCTITGNFAKPGNDTFSYSGVLDAKGETLSTLAGTLFVLRVGEGQISTAHPDGELFSGHFDDKGKVSGTFTTTTKGKTKTTTKTVVTYSPDDGALNIRLSGIDIATNLGAKNFQLTSPGQTLVLGIEFGEPDKAGVIKTSIRTTDVLRMATHVKSSGPFRMGYTIGKNGFSRSGGFQVVAVQGSDINISKTDTGDQWMVRFYGVPGQDVETATATTSNGKKSTVNPMAPAAADTIRSATDVTIQLGEFSQDLAVTQQAVRLIFKATGKDPGVFKFALDPTRFIHSLQTNPISSSDSNITPAAQSKDPTILPTGMDFTGFSGAAGRVIAPNRGSWVQR